jgi:hypothetical protein
MGTKLGPNREEGHGEQETERIADQTAASKRTG